MLTVSIIDYTVNKLESQWGWLSHVTPRYLQLHLIIRSYNGRCPWHSPHHSLFWTVCPQYFPCSLNKQTWCLPTVTQQPGTSLDHPLPLCWVNQRGCCRAIYEGTGQFRSDHQFDLMGKVPVLSEYFIVEVMRGYQMTTRVSLWAPTFQLLQIIAQKLYASFPCGKPTCLTTYLLTKPHNPIRMFHVPETHKPHTAVTITRRVDGYAWLLEWTSSAKILLGCREGGFGWSRLFLPLSKGLWICWFLLVLVSSSPPSFSSSCHSPPPFFHLSSFNPQSTNCCKKFSHLFVINPPAWLRPLLLPLLLIQNQHFHYSSTHRYAITPLYRPLCVCHLQSRSSSASVKWMKKGLRLSGSRGAREEEPDVHRWQGYEKQNQEQEPILTGGEKEDTFFQGLPWDTTEWLTCCVFTLSIPHFDNWGGYIKQSWHMGYCNWTSSQVLWALCRASRWCDPSAIVQQRHGPWGRKSPLGRSSAGTEVFAIDWCF